MKNILLLSISLVISSSVFAQFQGNVYTEDNSIKITAYGKQKFNAWCGGMSNPQFAVADLNHDGKNDMVIYEWGNYQIKTFINQGTIGNPKYVYAPHYVKNFPSCYSYLKLEDYNNDGIPDLIDRGTAGFRVYKGYYNAATNELNFLLYKELYYESPYWGHANAYTQPSDIPGIVDVDRDGDLDFLGYEVNGAIINYYKNCALEHGKSLDSIEVCMPDNCWGKMNQGWIRTFTIGTNCNPFGQFGCRKAQPVAKTTMHSGNAICMIDIDGDGDMDMFDGSVSFDDLQLLINGKHDLGYNKDTIIAQDTFWKSLHMPTWPSAFWLDVDGDGDKDILVSPHALDVSENYKVAAYFKNMGSNAAPNFVYQKDTFMIEDMIDQGTGSYPFLYDYNKDGKLDLFVGSDGFYINNQSSKRSKIAYYQNTGSAASPEFTLINSDFLNLSAQNFEGASIAIGDLDNDGKDDFVIGHANGTLSFYKNNASSNTLQPNWQLNTAFVKTTVGDTIDVGAYATPFIYDIDKDGKPDLLVSHQNSSVYYYQNQGGTNVLSIKKITNNLGGMSAEPKNNGFGGYGTLFIGKIDNTGNDYILIGNDSGRIRRYSNFQSGNTTNPYLLIDSAYSHINMGTRSSIAIGHISSDTGTQEMIIGNIHGGLNLYKRRFNVLDSSSSTQISFINLDDRCQIYPNPAYNNLIIDWTEQFASKGTIKCIITNITGQTAADFDLESAEKTHTLETANYKEGLYFVQLISPDGNRYAKKIVILK